MTLTKFMARSTWVAHAFGWEKLLKCHMKGKASKKLANGQNIDYSEKRKRPKGFICPCTGVKYHNIQTCLLVYAADSGEHLQDHWSSGLRTYCNSGPGDLHRRRAAYCICESWFFYSNKFIRKLLIFSYFCPKHRL